MSQIPVMLSLWILILSNIAVNVLSQDLCPDLQPVPCKCEMVQQDDRGYYKLVNCSGLGLSFVPDNLPMDLQEIEFSVNNIMVTEIDAFKSFPNLIYLSLANNNIEYIPSMGFSNLEYLKELDITGNLLQNISEETFYGLRELEVLKGLETNQVLVNAFGVFNRLKILSITIASETIPEHIFETLLVHTLEMKVTKAKSLPDSIFNFEKNTLTNLTIESKSLLCLPAELLSGLRLLKIFILKAQNLNTLPHNLFHDVEEINVCNVALCKPVNLREIEIYGIKSLPRDLFQGQESIERITIRGIEDLPAGIFHNLVTLDDLDLSESKLTFISYNLFSSMSSLKTLTLRSCNLMSVIDNVFQGLTSLTYLDLSNNSIQILANCSFEPFRYSLEKLNLSGNHLTALDRHALKDMNYLTFLDIANNKLKNLGQDVFYDLIRLRSLSMRNNFMTSLPVSIFKSQRNLQEVDLSGNFLELLPKDLFKGTSSLKRIDLSNNIISTLPDGIVAYMYRFDLNLVNNPIHCECKLRSLIVRWIAASKILKIHGHCETPRYLYQTFLQSLTYDETCSDTDHASAMFSTIPSQPTEIFPIMLMPSSSTSIFTSSVSFADMTGIYSLMSIVENPQMITSNNILKTSFYEGKEMVETAPVAMILNSKLQMVPPSIDKIPYDVDVLETHSQSLATSTIVSIATDPSQPIKIFLNTLMPSSATNIFSSSDYFAQMTRIYPSTAESPQIITNSDVPKTSYSFSEGKEMQTTNDASVINSKLPSSMDEKYLDIYVKEMHTPILASATIGSEYPSSAFPVTSILSTFPVTYPLSTFPKDGNEDLSRITIEPTPAYSGWSRSEDDWSSKLTQETTTSMAATMTVNATTIAINVSVEETKKATTSNQTIISINETIQLEFLFPNQSLLISLLQTHQKTAPVGDIPSFYVAITVVIISFAIGISFAAIIAWRKRHYRQRIYEVTPVSSKENASRERTMSKDNPVTTVSLIRIDNERN